MIIWEYQVHVRVLDNIASDLVVLETGAVGACTPESFQMEIALANYIDDFETFLKAANNNNIQNADRVIDIGNILVKFDFIKKLMLQRNANFRQDAIDLFTITGNLYSSAQMREFVDWLNEGELQHIMQIVHQEETLMEKTITNTPIHILTLQRISQMKGLRITDKEEETDYEDGR